MQFVRTKTSGQVYDNSSELCNHTVQPATHEMKKKQITELH